MSKKSEHTTQPELEALIGKQIVVDTDSSYVYIGVLEATGSDYLALSGVDVHDTGDSKTTKEAYAHETKKLGARSNRKHTLVRIARILSISLLEDIISF
jgi:small nuclear ribonucleoprotein (snRNP)-like protein